MKYDKTKEYRLNPKKTKYILENFHAFSALEEVRHAEDLGKLAKQIYDVLDINVPIHIVEEMWGEYSGFMSAQFMTIGDEAELNVMMLIETSDWFVEVQNKYDSLYKTFAEWKSEGRCVTMGEHSHKRNQNGQAVFCLNQTTTILNIPSSGPWTPWQDSPDEAHYVNERSRHYINWDNPDKHRITPGGYTDTGDDAMPEDRRGKFDAYGNPDYGRFYEWNQEY